MTGDERDRAPWRPSAGWRRAPATRRIAAKAVMASACFVVAASGAQEFSGRVSIADGGPLTVIRHDQLLSASTGAALVAGDMMQTAPEAFAVVQFGEAAIIGLGPGTQLYVQQRADQTILMVPKGWLKVDWRSGGLRLVGRRLGAESRHTVLLLYSDERSDALFDEQGSASLLLHDAASVRVAQQTQANQFFLRADGGEVAVRPRPSPEFVERMPVAFRDALPAGIAVRGDGTTIHALRPVTYADIQSWLMMPPDWRTGLIERFRGRLKDPEFFAAMDAHLSLHPDWRRILHPPPRPDSAAGPDRLTPSDSLTTR